MAIKQGRYITADTTGKKEMAIRTTELDKVKDDPFVRKSEVQQTVNNSTLPVSSRAVNLAINSIELPSLDGYATEDYVGEALESVDSRIEAIGEEATEAKAGADRAEQAVGDTVGTGKIMREGAWGFGGTKTSFDLSYNNFGSLQEIRSANIPDKAPSKFNHHSVINMNYRSGYLAKIAVSVANTTPEMAFYGWTEDDFSSEGWAYVYHSKNTTVDSNGFIKTASPIIKLFNDRIEANDSFKGEPDFKKIDTGVYQISGTLGLAKDGWYIEIPRDRNGFPYFLVEWEQDENNVVTIRTFKRKIDLETLDFVNGEPVDIREDQRWIDLRFHEEPVEVEDGEI